MNQANIHSHQQLASWNVYVVIFYILHTLFHILHIVFYILLILFYILHILFYILHTLRNSKHLVEFTKLIKIDEFCAQQICRLKYKKISCGLKRLLSGQEHILPVQSIWVQFPVFSLSSSYWTACYSSSRSFIGLFWPLWDFLSHMHIPTYMFYKHIIKNKIYINKLHF